jgi:hypothetical protein
LGFSVEAAPGSTGLQAMLPATVQGKRLSTLLGPAGQTVPVTLRTIKGIEYAFFVAGPGAYGAQYA